MSDFQIHLHLWIYRFLMCMQILGLLEMFYVFIDAVLFQGTCTKWNRKLKIKGTGIKLKADQNSV